MSDSICRFVPASGYSGHIRTAHFVYETDFHTLRQPFFYSIFRLHLVTQGSGTLHSGEKTYPLTEGCLFFAFPASLYTIDADDDFSYCYISFMGADAPSLLTELGITPEQPVCSGFSRMIPFWLSAIEAVTERNIHLLTESVLLYTLSFVGGEPDAAAAKQPAVRRFDAIIDYVDTHFRDRDLSLTKLSSIFPYTEKYLSALFKKHLDLNFRTYLNNLRLQYAVELIERGFTSVSEIAELCGYSDSLYFSKVFKKRKEISPAEYIRQRDTQL